MNGDFTQEGIPYQTVPTYSDPYQDILSEDAVIFAPNSVGNTNNSNVNDAAASGSSAAPAKHSSPTRSIRSSSNDRVERGERDPLLSTGRLFGWKI